MPNPPYSGSVIVIHENQDGLVIDLFHWADVPEGMSTPPIGPLSVRQLVGGVLKGTGVTTIRKTRNCPTRADAKTKFAQFLDQSFPDTAAGT